MSNKSGVSEQVISLPRGGGALHGIGEKFALDLHTGTGNFSVPITVPSNRNGFQPELTLTYSTGNGNGPFGLGWALSIPGVSLKTSKGIPRYQGGDTYVLSGAEDLVLVEDKTVGSGTQQERHCYYRPRTEGLFARIVHIIGNGEDRWEVTSKSGLKSVYGKDAGSRLYDEEHPEHVFQWLLSETVDTFGNRILYTYKREDRAELDEHRYEANHDYNQVYLWKIQYGDYRSGLAERFLFSLEFDYGEYDEDGNLVGIWGYRPDPFSTYRAGFEMRTVRRCRHILIKVHEENEPLAGRLIKSYRLRYMDELSEQEREGESLPPNGASLLSEVTLTGHRADREDDPARDSQTLWNSGWLADGTRIYKYIPVNISSLKGIVSLKANGLGLALTSDATVWAWGSNASGQLGDGTTTDRHTPVRVSNLTGIVRIAAGNEHGLALTSDGKVWAWGQNAYGRLGNGTTEYKPVPRPVQVSGLSDIVEIAAGKEQSFALRSDGTVWAWGYNAYGQLGDGTKTDRPVPVQVSGLEGIVAIGAGHGHGLALKSDGTVWTWGVGWWGELGDGNWAISNTPVQVRGENGEGFLTDVKAIEGGVAHSLALKSDGTVWAWGANDASPLTSGSDVAHGGQLGDGTKAKRNTPVRVSGLVGIEAIAGGGAHSLALGADGTVWTWGANLFGQLGDGTTEDKLVPTQLDDLGGAVAIAAGVWGSLALTKQPETISEEALPPLAFCYSRFEPEERDFVPLRGADLPARSLANPDTELVDLFGNGLPDIFETNGTIRYWRNLGDGKFDLPREMRDAPAGLRLADQGVQMIDADGNGWPDLLVTNNGLSGYYPLRFGGLWDRHSFQRFEVAPSFNLEDPEVKLVDLDGDGMTDVVRSGSRLECFFNDVNGQHRGWTPDKTRWVERRAVEDFPNVNFSDPRVKWADMTGDGLQDIVLVHDGSVEYWPNLGHGDWGRWVFMGNSPRFPYGYDPKRILVEDVDGDGAADIVYVDDTEVTLWINNSGNGWSEPIVIRGTPSVSDTDAVRLADMMGTGVSGVLWSADAGGPPRDSMLFLDFTGGTKPYLLGEMDNHMGSVTRVGYAPSTRFYLEDQKRSETRWKTPLPFPVQVVARVEVIDAISQGKLTTEYKYHHGYWDGAEREFRGFGMVEQLDTETFEDYNQPGLHGEETAFAMVRDQRSFSPPTLTKTWFHQGPIGDEFGEWEETDFSTEFWPGDSQMLSRPPSMTDFLNQLPRRVKRDALRTLRGRVLRTELYALDGTEREPHPYTVTESSYGVCEVVDEIVSPSWYVNLEREIPLPLRAMICRHEHFSPTPWRSEQPSGSAATTR